MSREPRRGARQKLATALPARETDDRERATVVVRSTYVRETQKVERVWSLAVCRLGLGSEASKEQQPRLVVGQFQIEPREPLSQISVEVLRVPLVLETCHKIIGKPNQVRLTPEPPPHFLLEPQVEHKVQIHVGQDWAERAALRRTRLRANDNAVLHDAGPEPLANQAQDDTVCNAESPPDVRVAADRSWLSTVRKYPGLGSPARARTPSSFLRPLRLRRAGSSAARSREETLGSAGAPAR